MAQRMFRMTSQVFNQDGSVNTVSENFLNGVLAQAYDGATISGTVAVDPHGDEPGAEARVQVNLTITPLPA